MIPILTLAEKTSFRGQVICYLPDEAGSAGDFHQWRYNAGTFCKSIGEAVARDLKEDFFRLDGAWASFELMSIRRRDDYLKPFRVLRCKIDDQVDFQAPELSQTKTEATVLIEIFGAEELVAASGLGPVHAVDNAMRKILEKHYPQLSEVRLEEFDVRLLHGAADDQERGAGAPVRVLAIFSDGSERWGTVGVAADILQASVECIIDGLEWKLRGEHKH